MDKLPLPLTALYASFMGFTLVAISMRVAQLRNRYKADLKTSDNMELLQATHAHSNFAEHVPLALFLLGVAEVNGAAVWAIHVFGLTLIISRILHVHGLYRTPGKSLGRDAGMIGTWSVTASLCLLVLYQIFL